LKLDKPFQNKRPFVREKSFQIIINSNYTRARIGNLFSANNKLPKKTELKIRVPNNSVLKKGIAAVKQLINPAMFIGYPTIPVYQTAMLVIIKKMTDDATEAKITEKIFIFFLIKMPIPTEMAKLT